MELQSSSIFIFIINIWRFPMRNIVWSLETLVFVCFKINRIKFGLFHKCDFDSIYFHLFISLTRHQFLTLMRSIMKICKFIILKSHEKNLLIFFILIDPNFNFCINQWWTSLVFVFNATTCPTKLVGLCSLFWFKRLVFN